MSAQDFLFDVNLVFDNAKRYNPPGSDCHLMAQTLQVGLLPRQHLRDRGMTAARQQVGNTVTRVYTSLIVTVGSGCLLRLCPYRSA